MQMLHGKEAEEIRELFICTFVDTESDYYLSRIKATLQFSDGAHYTGYLWDCLKDRDRVSYQYVVSKLNNKLFPFYVLWDVHSRDRDMSVNCCKYPIDAVLLTDSSELNALLVTLPEDCYFFDESLSWAYAVTHEELRLGRRLCYAVYDLKTKS